MEQKASCKGRHCTHGAHYQKLPAGGLARLPFQFNCSFSCMAKVTFCTNDIMCFKIDQPGAGGVIPRSWFSNFCAGLYLSAMNWTSDYNFVSHSLEIYLVYHVGKKKKLYMKYLLNTTVLVARESLLYIVQDAHGQIRFLEKSRRQKWERLGDIQWLCWCDMYGKLDSKIRFSPP